MTGIGNGNGNGATIGTSRVKQGLAQMLKGGVIVSTTTQRKKKQWRRTQNEGIKEC